MLRSKSHFLLLILALLTTAAHSLAAAPKQADPKSAESQLAPAPLPELKAVRESLKTFFAKQHNYREGDLITREQVTRYLKDLEKLGWKLDAKDQDHLLQQLLPEQHFLVRQFHTTAGLRFMRKIAGFPLGYDRVHRLSHLPGGEKRVQEFIYAADGYKMIEYMATTNGGKNLGNMLANVPDGKDFNKPTGSIYTATQLEKSLTQLYHQEVTRREAATKKDPVKKDAVKKDSANKR